ncbi:MAG: hypothetical protein K6U00_11360 [Armatimonadetes bacterium]|nr:hypothetical protein [Armatimonadota bacterium]
MKRAAVLLLTAGLLAAGVALAGCGEKKTTLETPEGKVEVSEEGGGKITYKTGEGEATYEAATEAPSEEELGAPLYPGAAYVPESGGSVSGVAPEGEFTTVGGEFRTPDPFRMVLAWYRERLGEPLFQEESQSTATWSRREGGKMVLVGLRGEASGTTISIYNLQGSEELLP